MKNKLLAVLLTALSIGTLIILGYKENGIKISPSYKTSSMRDFRLTHKEGDKIIWELISANATFPEGNKKVLLTDLKMKIHNQYDIELTGGSGIYMVEEKNLLITKPIEVDINGSRLITDSLAWDGEKEVITSNDMITFKGRDFLIEGTGLHASTKDQKIKILENVKGTFYR